MKNSNMQEMAEKAFWLNLLEMFDTGKAIVAALTIGVLGYLANLLTSLYSFVYWNSYFECFNLPIQYFESAVDSASSFYGFVVALIFSVVYLIVQVKYNNTINNMIEKTNKRNPRSNSIYNWFLRSSTYIALPILSFVCSLFVLIFFNGGNDFILSMIISSLVMNSLISIFLGIRNRCKTTPNTDRRQPSEKATVHRFWAAGLIIGITVFLLSLFFVYLLGYFQKVILVDIPQVITVESDDTAQQYGKLLETDSSYICAPITYVEGKEFIMHIQNNSYRVIPKDEIVTIATSDAWALYRDKGAGLLFDFIAYDEDAFLNLLAGFSVFSVILLYGEYLLLIKRRKKPQNNTN